MEKFLLAEKMSKEFEWRKWVCEIPFIKFKKDWIVQPIPPFSGAVARFRVKKENYKNCVSVYLDCYKMLGYCSKPYWEVYPYDDDVYRCEMHDTDNLISAISKSLRQIRGRK